MATLGAHTLRTQTIPKGPKPIAVRPRLLGWKLEKFDIFMGGQNSFPLISRLVSSWWVGRQRWIGDILGCLVLV